MAMAKISCGAPKSNWIHCKPFFNIAAVSSPASLLPSVIFAKSMALTVLSLQVIFLPGAMLRTSLGTIKGGGGLTGRGSTSMPAGASLGVPVKTGDGNFNLSGTKSLDLDWSSAKTRADCPKQNASTQIVANARQKLLCIPDFIWI